MNPNLAMRRLDGRTPRGERVAESVPRTYGAHTSPNGATSLSGVEAVVAVEGAVDPDVFNAYLEQVLRQTFRVVTRWYWTTSHCPCCDPSLRRHAVRSAMIEASAERARCCQPHRLVRRLHSYAPQPLE
ncbi:MAG: hypothetical protein AABN95_15425 [Acidobacteriota bacterium]